MNVGEPTSLLQTTIIDTLHADALKCTSISYIMYLEDAWRVVLAAGQRVRGVIVIDVHGCGLDMLNYLSVVRRLSSAGVLHYPEISEKVYIANAGWVLSTLWAAIRPFLPTRTQNKVTVISGGAVDVIIDEVEGGRASLPQFLGGDLLPEQCGVCPGVSVDDAYRVVVREILGGGGEEGGEQRYSDEMEFLEAAIRHFSQYDTDPLLTAITQHLATIHT